MAEVVGLVASIITLIQVTHAVAEGVRRAIDLYRAPEEIRVLQEQVELFQNVLQATDAHYSEQAQGTLVALALTNARNVMGELKEVVTVKLVRQRHPFSRFLDSNWLRYKGDVVRLCSKLKEARETLREALNLDLLISTRRIESSLTVITHSLAQRPASTTTNKPLQAMRNLKSPWPAKALELSPSFFPESYTNQSMPDLVCYYAREVQSSEFVRTNHCALYFSRSPRVWVRLTASITTNIESIFWKTWRTTDREADCNFQLDRTGFPEAIGNSISSYFSQHPRELTQDSHLSIYLGSSSSQNRIPTTATITEIDNDPNTSSSTTATSKTPTTTTNPPNTLTLIPIAKATHKPDSFKATLAYLHHLTQTSLRHMSCPRYHEKQIIQQLMRSPYGIGELRDKFIAFVDARWVAVSKFGSSRNLVDLALYTLQVLHCLRGKGGSGGRDILAGIVLDSDGVVTSFLRELPGRGYLLLLMERSRLAGEGFSMARREKWCRQLVRGVVDVHSLQFGPSPYVVGMLGEVCNGIAVDGDDQAVLFDCFQPRFRLDQSRYPGLPPEDHEKYPFECFAGECESTSVIGSPRTDVYQLGLLLWRIASYRPFGFSQNGVYPFCEGLASCDGCCVDPRGHSVPLPLPEFDEVGERIPEYIRGIVAACRIENPDERPAAWELLDMFPPLDSKSTDIIDDCGELEKSQHLTRPEDCDGLYGGIVFCDVCGNPILTSHHYQCHVCHGSDYDICPGCFEAGGHCPEPEHVLTEYRPSQSTAGTYSVKYYTSVKERGIRELVGG